MVITNADKAEFKLLLEIRELKRQLGLAEQEPRKILNLKTERDRLRRIVTIINGH